MEEQQQQKQSTIQNKAIETPDTHFHEPSFIDATDSIEELNPPDPISDPDTIKDDESTITFIPDPSSPSSSVLRHRRLVSFKSCNKDSNFFKHNQDGLIDLHPDNTSSSSVSQLNQNFDSISEICSESDERRLTDEPDATSAITGENNNNNANNNSGDGSLIYILAELVIKVVSFQTKLLSNSVMFPIWLLHSLYVLITDPFGVIKVVRSYVIGNGYEILGIFYSGIKLVNHLLFKKNESTFRLCFRIGWGLLWFCYCGFVLVSLLVSAFLFGGVMIKGMVEEPVQITDKLTFDYTKDTPMAFVPISSCPEFSVLVDERKGMVGSFGESRVIPFDHEVQATVSLTLPESDYNINLGIFQVRMDFLSSDGNVLASTRQPCMLQFKSQPIRLVSTFLKLASLLTGYSSETQTLDIKFSGYTEKDVHTSCSRVVIEQRAEFARRGGVPEIYSASLKIESRLPFVKRMLWYSKWLIYMWISVTTYIMELSFMLLCCRPIIFPWELYLSGSGSTNNGASHNRLPSGSR